jgi:hypothetical protein
MVIVWLLARNKKILGKWTSPIWLQILLAVATLAMFALPILWLIAG